jgi:hypothetical protein
MAMNKISHRLLRIGLVGVVTLMFMMVTSPDKVPAILLVVPFVGLFSLLYLIVLEAILFLGPDEDENGAIVRLRHPRLVAGLAAGFPVLLLVLQSVVELTWWDVVIAFAVLILAYLYIARGVTNFRGL